MRKVLLIKAQRELEQGRSKSSILMNVPKYNSVDQLVELANDKDGWQLDTNLLCYKPRQTIEEKHKTVRENISKNIDTNITHT